MTKLLNALLALTLGCGLAAAEDKTNKPGETPKLEGTYTIVSGEENGKAVAKERVDGAMIVFTDKTVVGTDKSKTEFFSCTYTIDTSKTPWAITLTDAKQVGAAEKDKKPAEKATSSGLIKQDGDTVTIIYSLAGGKAPTEFKTGDNQMMFVMKRADKK
jgi:uncharacterized protein (TIGR03067 family)